MITGVAALLMMPWKLLTDFNSYIFGWLIGHEYRNGVNGRALPALAARVVVAIVPALRWLYDYAWFVGFAVSGLVYFAAMRRKPF
ncbi:MAG: hypothetical protein ABJC09_13610 [Terriglobia bacterium]